MAVHELFAYLRARDADAAIVFYKRAFEATERFRLVEPGGRISHAELHLGPAVLMVSAEFPASGINAPDPAGHSTFVLPLHVDAAATTFEPATAARPRPLPRPHDHFHRKP